MVLLALPLIALSAGCYQGRPTSKPPIHVNPNMDAQPKYEPMEKSAFFANRSAMRLPVEGTIARGNLREDVVFYTGKTADGKPVKTSPVTTTLPLLQRGQKRYNIYCSPCHSQVGDGQGIIVKRGYVPPPTFHDKRLRDIQDGHIFDVISNGIRNMPSYRHQVPVEDRWAIVAYLRALQLSQNAATEDVPEEMLRKLQK